MTTIEKKVVDNDDSLQILLDSNKIERKCPYCHIKQYIVINDYGLVRMASTEKLDLNTFAPLTILVCDNCSCITLFSSNLIKNKLKNIYKKTIKKTEQPTEEKLEENNS